MHSVVSNTSSSYSCLLATHGPRLALPTFMSVALSTPSTSSAAPLSTSCTSQPTSTHAELRSPQHDHPSCQECERELR
jgi:hypothetical protein